MTILVAGSHQAPYLIALLRGCLMPEIVISERGSAGAQGRENRDLAGSYGGVAPSSARLGECPGDIGWHWLTAGLIPIPSHGLFRSAICHSGTDVGGGL